MDDYIPKGVRELVDTTTATTVGLIWTISENQKPNIFRFNIRYYPEREENEYQDIKIDGNQCHIEIAELKSETEYEFKVRSILPKGVEKPFSDPVRIKTMPSVAKQFSKQEYKLDTDAPPNMHVFKMPLEEFDRLEPSKLRKCRLKGGK